MFRTMFKSKIHRATVTQADLHYVGSVTIDADLLDAADLLPGELVHIVDITNGARLETYVIEGERGSGVGEVGGGTVDADHSGAALPLDDVCLEPGAVGDVDDVDELTGQQIGGVEEIRVDGHRSHVVQVGL